MGAEIDRLEVQVEAQARSANAQLDTLVGKLNNVANSLMRVNGGGLTGLANGVQRFAQAAGGLSNVKTADFTRLSKNIASLSALNAQQMYGASSAISTLGKSLNNLQGVSNSSMQVAEMAKNISKLGGVNVQRAITNLPQLATAMSNLMVALSKAPAVSNNIIQMTNALANLASQGGKAGAAANTVSNSLNAQARSATHAAKASRTLASVIGSLYQKYFLIMRVAPKVWSSVESSMDFLETVNYFEVAMRKIGDDAVKTWDGNGYASAEAYAESFSDRLKQLTTKMTGFEVDESGNATYTGVKNLGMNPDDVMQWQAVYAQMTDSLGMAEESTLHFSKALTMLGADWASLRNLDFDTAWNKFASALAGQSRAVRSLGIDVTQATLQEYAYKYGLEQSVQEMNQATKAQLRLLAILDQSKVAYGDLANTIGSPSNQLRMLTQNVDNLGRVIGNLFLPIIQNTLPYINGFVIALQNLFQWVGKLLGIKFDSINSSMGGMDDTVADLVGGADDLGGALDDANKSAQKLNKTLQPWHEINNITTKDNSDAGSSGSSVGSSDILDDAIFDALTDYEKVWNEAFVNMENKAQRFAEVIGKYLKPVRYIIEDFAVGDYFKAGQDTSKLVAGIFNFFADAIDNVDWEQIGKNIGDYLEGLDWMKIFGSVGHLAWEALKAGFELWHGAFSEAPFEMTLVTLTAMPKALKAITATKFVTGITKLAKKFGVLGKSANSFLKNLDATGQIFTFNTGIEAIRSKLTRFQKGVIGTTAVIGEFFLLKDGFYDIAKGADNFVESLAQIAIGAGAAVGALKLIGLSNPWTAAIVGITAVVSAIAGINKAIDEIRAEEIGNIIKDAMSTPGGVPIGELSKGISDALSDAALGFSELSSASNEVTSVNSNIKSVVTEIGQIKQAMDLGVLAVEKGKNKLNNLFSQLVELTGQKMSALTTYLLGLYGEGGALSHVYDETEYSAQQVTDAIIRAQYATTDAAQAIYAKMQEVDFGSSEWNKLYEQLLSTSNEMQDFEKAALIFSDNIKSIDIDWGELYPNGELNTEALDLLLGDVSSSLDEYLKVLDESEKNAKLYWNEMLENAATPEDKALFQQLLDDVPEQFDTMRRDAKLEVTAFVNMLQTDFINKTAEIIKDADSKWTGAFGQGTEGNYIKEAVDNHNKQFEKLQSEIEASFSQLKENGVADAKATMEAIYGELFSQDYVGSFWQDLINPKYALNEDYDSIIKNATQVGIDVKDGYISGMSKNTESVSAAGASIAQAAIDAVRETNDSHSPSKVYEELAKDTVDGYNLGITRNADSTIQTIQKYIESITSVFGGIVAQTSAIGAQTMQGFIDGMDSMSDKVSEKAQNIADSVSNTVQTALDIHSPSRVMFSLGEYTVEGFKLGVENMFENFKKSFGQYTANSVDYLSTGMYTADYRNALGRESIVNNEYISNYGNQNDMYETNELLREQNQLLIGLLNKETGITEDAVFKATRNKAKEFYKRTGISPYPV